MYSSGSERGSCISQQITEVHGEREPLALAFKSPQRINDIWLISVQIKTHFMLLLQSQEMGEKLIFCSRPIKTKWEFNLQVLLSEVIKEVI